MKPTHPSSPVYREKRPIDVITPPKVKKGRKVALSDLPESWQVALKEADEWPYPDPDSNGLSDPEPTFGDYPSDPSSLPADIEPFSEDEPWGQMFSESERQYELFSYYRSLGITRTKRAVMRHFEVSSPYISKLAGEKNWDTRVKAWDDYRERIYTAELIAGVKEMAHKHAEIARDGVEALSSAFAGIVESMKDPDQREEFLAELNELPAKTKLALAQGSARVIPNLMNAERLSRGLPTEISHELHSHEARVTVQTTDDLYDILTGLAGPLAVARSGEAEEEIIDVE